MHRLEPDPAAAPSVARIFQMYIDGMSDRAIASQLTREGLPLPLRPRRRPQPPPQEDRMAGRSRQSGTSSTPATPAARSRTNSARRSTSTTSTTSPSATAPA
ncbi:recombinase family protein [Streptomyces sp. NPDC086777]|uniref:recombinase family protein n=1 Tax=Streptomyces sp. NPDC086777 TaxID=3154866 RepID=UPI00344E5AA4